MSEAVLLAGKRGSGKSLGAISMAQKYLKAGRTVATNLDIFIEHLVPSYCTTRFFRLPDFPTESHLQLLPPGNPDPTNEKKNGLLILDEAATFLNSREWNGEGRQKVISWLVQSRKFGWDLLLISQHANLIDKQIREALIEIQGTVRRMDKIQVPLLSSLYKYFTSEPLHFPQIHFVALRYGFQPDAPVADRWYWRGTEFHKCYDTLQRISPLTGQQGLSTMLSAYDLKGSKMKKWDLRRQMAAGGLVIGLLLGFAAGYAGHWYKAKNEAAKQPIIVMDDAKVKGVVNGQVTRVILTDGRTMIAEGMKTDMSGTQFKIGGRWYAEAK